MSEQVKAQKPMQYWRVKYFFRHGRNKGKQMGPDWMWQSKIVPTRHIYNTFEVEDYLATIERVSNPEEEIEG